MAETVKQLTSYLRFQSRNKIPFEITWQYSSSSETNKYTHNNKNGVRMKGWKRIALNGVRICSSHIVTVSHRLTQVYGAHKKTPIKSNAGCKPLFYGVHKLFLTEFHILAFYCLLDNKRHHLLSASITLHKDLYSTGKTTVMSAVWKIFTPFKDSRWG